MIEVINNTSIPTEQVIPFAAASCTERIQYTTSRFQSYGQVTSWQPLAPKAAVHTQSARFQLDYDDHLLLMELANIFRDARFNLWMGEFALSTPCDYRDNVITIPMSVPWLISRGDMYLFTSLARTYIATVNDVSRSIGSTTITLGGEFPPEVGDGVICPLKYGSLVGNTQFSTDLISSNGQINFEFETPRDYTEKFGQFVYTEDDLPKPKSTIAHVISLPDSVFQGRRVRGRLERLRGWGEQWGRDWGAAAREGKRTKDNSYQSNYNETLDERSDYIIKHVVARSLTSGTLLELYNDRYERDKYMLVSDAINCTYANYAYSLSLTYAQRTLRQ